VVTEAVVRARIVRIGNSQGIRIPKPLLEQAGLGDEVELTLAGRSLVLSPARPARAGWEAEFAGRAIDAAEDLIETPAPEFDELEWTW
jgi:antitoxin MazE